MRTVRLPPEAQPPATEREGAPGRVRNRPQVAVPLVLVMLAVLAYGAGLTHPFVFNDASQIVDKQSIRSLASLPHIFLSEWWADTPVPKRDMDKRYRPLVVATNALNYAVGSLNPVGYHLVNLLLHVAVSGLLFLLARRIGLSAGAALVAAALFVSHPLHSESVLQVANRTELMMAVGVLASLWLAARGRPVLSLVAFAAALLSKEQGVMLLPLLIWFDVCVSPCSRERQPVLAGLLTRYGPYVVVLAGYLILRTVAVGGIAPPPYPFVMDPLGHSPTSVWAPSTVMMAGHYLRLWLWPDALSADYSFDSVPLATSWLDPRVWWGLASWGGLGALGVWAYRRDRRVSLAVGLTVLMFLPTSNLLVPLGTPLAERVFYLPSAGLCLLVGLGWDCLTQRPAVSRISLGGSAASPRWGRLLLLLPVVLLALGLSVRTAFRTADWSSDPALFRSVLRVYPNNVFAHLMLGFTLAKSTERHDWEDAIHAYESAFRLYPTLLTTKVEFISMTAVATYALGTLYLRVDEPAKALPLLEIAAETSPNSPLPYTLLGEAHAYLGHQSEARDAWLMALARKPDDGQLLLNLGQTYVNLGQYQEARDSLTAAIEFAPQDARAHSLLSFVLMKLGDPADALGAAERALSLDERLAWAHLNRARALEALQRPAEAAEAYRRFLGLEPSTEAAAKVAEHLAKLEARTDIMPAADGRRGTPQRRRPVAPGGGP